MLLKTLPWLRLRSTTGLHRALYPPKADSFLQQLLLSRRNDAWIIVEGRAYDVTKYVEHHPGGWLPIANLAGKDVTDAFANYHTASVYEKLLPNYYVGDVIDYEVSDFVKEHRQVLRLCGNMWFWVASMH